MSIMEIIEETDVTSDSDQEDETMKDQAWNQLRLMSEN